MSFSPEWRVCSGISLYISCFGARLPPLKSLMLRRLTPGLSPQSAFKSRTSAVTATRMRPRDYVSKTMTLPFLAGGLCTSCAWFVSDIGSCFPPLARSACPFMMPRHAAPRAALPMKHLFVNAGCPWWPSALASEVEPRGRYQVAPLSAQKPARNRRACWGQPSFLLFEKRRNDDGCR